MRRRTIQLVGTVVVGLALVGVAVIRRLERLDVEAKDFVERSLPAIVDDWRVDYLLDAAAPEMLATTPRDKLADFYRLCGERLGSLRKIQTLKGQASVRLMLPAPLVVTGHFVADVEFEDAPARIVIATVLRHGEWRYTTFFVTSDALAPGSPAACRYAVPDPPEARPVYVTELGPHPTVTADDLLTFCHDKLHLAAERLDALPADGVVEDAERHQIAAEDVIALARKTHPSVFATPKSVVVIVTDRDMYVRDYTWQFAFSLRRDDQIAVISTARFDPRFFGASENRNDLWLRTTKVLQRDLAELYYRLPANDDPASLLHRRAPSIDALDHLPCAFGEGELERLGRKPPS